MSQKRYPKPTEKEERMLKVEDPVEMKTEPGTEILVAADPADAKKDPKHHKMHAHTHLDEVRIRGLGQVTPSGIDRRK